jgi:hypothetical protein
MYTVIYVRLECIDAEGREGEREREREEIMHFSAYIREVRKILR